MKKTIIAILSCLFAVILLGGCGNNAATNQEDAEANGDTVTVVATLFPQYDFARIVGGDKVTVTKLLPGGVESHSYEPTPSDIIEINEADIFFYTGKTMEPWAATVIDGLDSTTLRVADVSEGVAFLSEDHEEDEEAHEEEHAVDPHIWTDPTRAMIMVDNICKTLQEVDPKNSDYYQANATAYKEKLTALDERFQEIVAAGQRDKIIFGSSFAFLYFTDHYGLDYDAAIDSCSDSGEPSAKKIAELVDEINEDGIPVIYCQELASTTVAESIAEETGVEILILNSCHNVTDAQMKEGVSYLSLMEENAVNLEKGLK